MIKLSNQQNLILSKLGITLSTRTVRRHGDQLLAFCVATFASKRA